jgi:hypothetical protein
MSINLIFSHGNGRVGISRRGILGNHKYQVSNTYSNSDFDYYGKKLSMRTLPNLCCLAALKFNIRVGSITGIRLILTLSVNA